MTEEFTIEGRNAVLEAFRAGKTIVLQTSLHRSYIPISM